MDALRAPAAWTSAGSSRRPDPQAPRKLRGDGGAPAASPFTAFQGEPPLGRLRAEQLRIAAKVSRRNGFRTVRTIGGVDVAYAGDRGFASLVVLRARDLAVVEEVLVSQTVDFPYIPTYLAYREPPLVGAAFRRLGAPPPGPLADRHGQL